MDFTTMILKNLNNSRSGCITYSKTKFFKLKNSANKMMNESKRTQTNNVETEKRSSVYSFNPDNYIESEYKISSKSQKKLPLTNSNSMLNSTSSTHNLKQLAKIYKVKDDEYLKNEHPNNVLNLTKVKKCSFIKYGIKESLKRIKYAYCKTCDFSLARPICISCINICHKGHIIKYVSHKGYIKCACAEKKHKVLKNSNTNNIVECLCNEWIIISKLNIYYQNKNGEVICEMCHCYCDKNKNFNNKINLSDINDENKVNIPNCSCKNEEIHGDKKKLFEIILKLIKGENNFTTLLHPVKFVNMLFKSKQSFNSIFENFIIFDRKLKSLDYEIFINHLYQFSNLDLTYTNLYKCIVIIEKILQKITNQYVCFYCEEIRNFFSFKTIKKLIECIAKSNNIITEEFGFLLAKEYLYLFRKTYINYNVILLDKYKINDLKNLSFLQRILIFRENSYIFKESDDIINFLIKRLKNINIKGLSCIESFGYIKEIYSILRKLSNYYLISNHNMLKISIEILKSLNWIKTLRKLFIKNNEKNIEDIKKINDNDYFTKIELKLYYIIVKMLLNFIYSYNDRISYKVMLNKENIDVVEDNIGFIYKKDEVGRLISKITIVILTVSQKYYEKSNDKRNILIKRLGMEILEYYLNKNDNYMINLLRSINYYKNYSEWEDILEDSSKKFYEIIEQKERISNAYYKYFNFEINTLELYQIINDSLNKVLGKLSDSINSIYEEETEKGFSFNKNIEIIKTNYFYIILKVLDIIYYSNFQSTVNKEKEKTQSFCKNRRKSFSSNSFFKKIGKIKKPYSNDNSSIADYENQIITKIIYFYFCFINNSSENSFFIISHYFINELTLLPVKYSKLIFKLFYTCINNIAKFGNNIIVAETHIIKKLYNYLEILIHEKTNDDSLLICIHYFLRILQITTFNLRTSYFNILLYKIQLILLSLNNTYKLVSKFYEMKDSQHIIPTEEVPTNNKDENTKDLSSDVGNLILDKSNNDMKFSGTINLSARTTTFKTNIQISKNKNTNMTSISCLNNINNLNTPNNKNVTLNKCIVIFIRLINDCFDFSMNDDRLKINKIIKVDKVIFALKNYKLDLDLRTEFLRFLRKMIVDIQYNENDNDLYSKAIIDSNDNLFYIKNNSLISNLKYPTKLLSFAKDFYNITAKRSIQEKIKNFLEHINNNATIIDDKSKKLTGLSDIKKESISILKNSQLNTDIDGSDITHHHFIGTKVIDDKKKNNKKSSKKLNIDFRRSSDSLEDVMNCSPTNKRRRKKINNKNKLESDKSKSDDNNESEEDNYFKINLFSTNKKNNNGKEDEDEDEDEDKNEEEKEEEKYDENEDNEEEEIEKDNENNEEEESSESKSDSIDENSQNDDTDKISLSSSESYDNSSISDYNSNSESSNSYSENEKSEQKTKKEIIKDDDSDDDSDVFNNIFEKCDEMKSNKINSNMGSKVGFNLNNFDDEKSKKYAISKNFNKTKTKKNILKKSDKNLNDSYEKSNGIKTEKEKKKVTFNVNQKQENITEEKKSKKNINGVLKNRKTIIDNNSEKSERNNVKINKCKENTNSTISNLNNVNNWSQDELNKTFIKNNLIEAFDVQFYEVLQYELENLLINTENIDLNNPEDSNRLRNYFENGLLIPIIYYFKKTFAFIQDFNGKDLLKLYSLVEECISLKLYISGFKFDFWREQFNESNTIYLKSPKNFKGLHTNKISINLQNYGKTNIIKEPIIDGSCFIDIHSMELTYESLDYIRSGNISVFDYTGLYQIIDREFFALIRDRKKIGIGKMFEEENEFEITDKYSLIKEFTLYKKSTRVEKDSMEMKLIKIFIIYKYNKQICFNENDSALFSILSEIYYGYEISYRNLLIELLINNGKNMDFKNEFADMSYFLLYKLLSLQTNETQIDIIYLLGGQYSREIGFLQQFSQNLFNRIVLLFIDYLNPPDKIMQSNYFIAFNLIKIFKYLCESHNNFFQRHLIKSLQYFYIKQIPSFYVKKVDKLNNESETTSSKEEESILEKYFENDHNKDYRYSIKFFDFFLFTLTKLILISNWSKKSIKDENKQTPFFYDLFISILKLLIQMIQGNKAEILSALCEDVDDAIKDIFGDNFILPEFNNKLGLNTTRLNTLFSKEKNHAFEVFVKESVALIFKEKNNLELMYKIKNDIMEFFTALLEDKNVNDNMKKIIYKHLNISIIFENISYILKSYYLNSNTDFEETKTQDKDLLKKKYHTNSIYKKPKFLSTKPVLKLQELDNDKSIIPLIHTTTFLQPIMRPDINETIKKYNKIYMQKYRNYREKKKMNKSKNNNSNLNKNYKNLLNTKKNLSNSNCNLFAGNTTNNLVINTDIQNDLSKTGNSRNDKLIKGGIISGLTYQSVITNNRISKILERNKSCEKSSKMFEINKTDNLNFMKKISKTIFGKKLYKYFKKEFYNSEIFSKTIEFRLTNIFYRYIKLIDIQQKSVLNNSLIEEIMRINEKLLNAEEKQIIQSEIEVYDNYGTFEFNSQKTFKFNNSPNEKTLDKDLIERHYIVKFFEKFTKTVEIRTSEGKYQTVIFTNLKELKYLSEGTKFEFEKNVNRDNETSKKMDLLRYIEYFIKEIKFNKKYHKDFKRNFLNKIDFYYLEVSMYIYALFTNFFILMTTHGDNKISISGSEKNRRQSKKNIQKLIGISINNCDKVYKILSYIYISLNLILIISWLKLKLPLYYKIDKTKYKVHLKIPRNKKLSSCNKLYVLIKMSIINRKSFLLFVYDLIICLLSLLIPKGEIISAFLLLPIISINSTLKGILISVKLKYKELILTLCLAAIIMYVFSSFAFFFNNADFADELDYYEDNYCKTLAFAFLTAIDSGLRARGGLGDSAKRISFSRHKNHFIFRTILDDLFFLLIVITMIDVVFGIIIQSFVELRNKTQKYESDQSKHCFICHINKSTLEKNRFNFHEHIKTVHNLWNYVEYLIGLKLKKKQELSDIDNYVKIKIENKDISCLPTYKKLSKQNLGEDMENNNEQIKLIVPDENTANYKLRIPDFDKANKDKEILYIDGLSCY